MKTPRDPFPFKSSEEEITEGRKPPKEIPLYPLAFVDQEFLLRRELRPIRLSLEFLKAEMKQQEAGILSTIVVFGSARTLSEDEAKQLLYQAETELKDNPNNTLAEQKYDFAKKEVEKSFYYEEARRFAKIISTACQTHAQNDFVIVTGGGPGIMEGANRGAYDANGKSVGLNIFLPREQGMNPYISPELNFQFHYFAIRKMHFLIRSRALIFFPGGYGTFDELFETLTLMQTHKIKKIPILLFSKKFWTKAVNFDFLIEEGVIDALDVELFKYVETAEEAWAHIASFYKIDPKTCKSLTEGG